LPRPFGDAEAPGRETDRERRTRRSAEEETSSMKYRRGPPVPSAPKAQPWTEASVRPSFGAPLPMSLRAKLVNRNRSLRQPVKSSANATVQRSASSLVDPRLRLSRRSTNSVAPLPVP
jgi:hypothetical protein